MNCLRALPALFLALACLNRCVPEGGGSDTTTLSGTVQAVDGSPAPGARLKLFPAGYSPADPGAEPPLRAESDGSGRFAFRGLETGRRYTLLSSGGDGTWAFADSLSAGEQAGAFRLAPARVFYVSVYDSAFETRDSGIAYFPGTDILARCGAGGDVEIDSIPAGLRRVVVEGPDGWKHDSVLAEAQDTLYVKADPASMTVGGTRAWASLDPGTSRTLRSVWFPAPSLGYAAGDGGTLLKTADGESWVPLPSGTGLDLRAVCVRGNPNAGWAVGDSGLILRTSDGGATWMRQDGGTTATLHGVHRPAAGSNRGWIVGDSGIILRTLDGGASWSRIASGVPQTLRAVHFPDSAHGLAVGDGGLILHSADGGASWTQQASGTANNLHSVRFLGIKAAYAVGDGGTVLKGSSGGKTWAVQASGTSQRLNSVFFTDANSGYAVGAGGLILQTMDGGARWTVRNAAGSAELFSVHFPSPAAGFVSGQDGTVLKTSL